MSFLKECGWTVFFALFFFACTAILASRGLSKYEDHTYLNPPPQYMEWFHFGFRESMADGLWLRWIQDADYCQVYGGTVQAASPSEDRKYDPANPLFNPRHKVCDNSWAFKMLDAVTRMAPKFKMPYLAGTITLAVLVEDYKGADVLFDRAVAQFPDDWQILYRAAYHKLFDRQDNQAAGDLLMRAAQLGAPTWVKMLAARAYSRAGQAALGLKILTDFEETLTDKTQKEAVEKRIAEIKERMSETK